MPTKRRLKIKDEFADIAAAYPEDMLSCRDTGHHWTPSTAVREANGSIRRILVCSACGTNRNQIIDRYGYIVSGSYTYTDGYIIPGWPARRTPARSPAPGIGDPFSKLTFSSPNVRGNSRAI